MSLAGVHLACLYMRGEEVEQNYQEAAILLEKHVEADGTAPDIPSQMYDKGQGVQQSYVDAAKWYRKSAEKE